MDVRFCRVQEPSAERHTCAAIDPDQTHNALSRARTDDSCFSVDKDLHGCRLYLNRHMDGRDRVKCEVDFPPLTGRELDRFSGFGASRIRIPGQRENIVQRTLRVMEQLEMVPGHSPDSDVIHARRQVNKFILSSL
jgi:hypothetical protein